MNHSCKFMFAIIYFGVATFGYTCGMGISEVWVSQDGQAAKAFADVSGACASSSESFVEVDESFQAVGQLTKGVTKYVAYKSMHDVNVYKICIFKEVGMDQSRFEENDSFAPEVQKN